MMSKHLLYGLRGSVVVAAAEAVGVRLGCRLQERDSDVSGVYYYVSTGEASIRVEEPLDFEDELKEPDFPDYQTLINVDGTTEVPSLEGVQVLGEPIQLLRARELFC